MHDHNIGSGSVGTSTGITGVDVCPVLVVGICQDSAVLSPFCYLATLIIWYIVRNGCT